MKTRLTLHPDGEGRVVRLSDVPEGVDALLGALLAANVGDLNTTFREIDTLYQDELTYENMSLLKGIFDELRPVGGGKPRWDEGYNGWFIDAGADGGYWQGSRRSGPQYAEGDEIVWQRPGDRGSSRLSADVLFRFLARRGSF